MWVGFHLWTPKATSPACSSWRVPPAKVATALPLPGPAARPAQRFSHRKVAPPVHQQAIKNPQMAVKQTWDGKPEEGGEAAILLNSFLSDTTTESTKEQFPLSLGHTHGAHGSRYDDGQAWTIHNRALVDVHTSPPHILLHQACSQDHVILTSCDKAQLLPLSQALWASVHRSVDTRSCSKMQQEPCHGYAGYGSFSAPGTEFRHMAIQHIPLAS